MITMDDFDKLDIRVGTVLTVKINRKAKNPAYAMTIDFGGELGVKKTSSQITRLYAPEALLGRQVVCCVNLPAMYVGLVKSEVRVLAVEAAQGTVLLQPSEPVENGAPVR